METSRLRFLKVGTDEEVKVPNVGPSDHRSIVTPEFYLFFRDFSLITTWSKGTSHTTAVFT